MVGDKLLRPNMAAAKLGLAVRTFYREISLGNIPRGIQITERAQGWRESVIDQVIADREAGLRSSPGLASERRKPGRPRKLGANIAENAMADHT
ncbi:AlpA family phage regulatory protein [Rhizobium cauense]|uniref:helix-turn-helix transcriptional regulator n=1 Tax=Rhizobium cauense TaxID=1166683 RepID=UPI001C6DF425|nr:AlpA family phage regulatory protein [Rhizobium cauense]MBW9116626.1 AlpA family phage regulatory protein [Rhizobium cauense]